MDHVVFDALGRVVGQESVANAQLPEPRQKGVGEIKQRPAAIKGAIQIERHMTNSAEVRNHGGGFFQENFVHYESILFAGSLPCKKIPRLTRIFFAPE
jgi:hypothetical protein